MARLRDIGLQSTSLIYWVSTLRYYILEKDGDIHRVQFRFHRMMATLSTLTPETFARQADEVGKSPRCWDQFRGQVQEEKRMAEYTAVVKKEGDWWIGWIEEIPGVNCQERTHQELLETLRVTLREALEFNRQEAKAAAGPGYEEQPIAV